MRESCGTNKATKYFDNVCVVIIHWIMIVKRGNKHLKGRAVRQAKGRIHVMVKSEQKEKKNGW